MGLCLAGAGEVAVGLGSAAEAALPRRARAPGGILTLILAVGAPSGLNWTAEDYVPLHTGSQWQPTSAQRLGLRRSESRGFHVASHSRVHALQDG